VISKAGEIPASLEVVDPFIVKDCLASQHYPRFARLARNADG